jgi:nucleoside-diphosphate-sugar epimerase
MNLGFYRGARVVVTGASGFLGRRLAWWLGEAGAEVHATSRAAQTAQNQGNMRWHQADSAALPALVSELRPEVVFHLAGRMERDRRPEWLVPMLEANALPVAALAAALAEVGRGRLVIAGSAEEYGSAPGPWRESQREEPVSPYGLSKSTAAGIVAAAHRACGLQAVVGRLSVLYGPGQRSNQFIPGLIAACLAGQSFAMTRGEQLRDFLFVDDAVEGLATLGAGSHFGRAFNLCSGRSIAVIELARRAAALIGQGRLDVGALEYRPAEAMRQEMCPDDALALLGWRARVSLDEGLRLTIEAARAGAALPPVSAG